MMSSSSSNVQPPRASSKSKISQLWLGVHSRKKNALDSSLNSSSSSSSMTIIVPPAVVRRGGSRIWGRGEHNEDVCKISGHAPKIDKPRLLSAAIACFLAAKCSVLMKFWTFKQSLVCFTKEQVVYTIECLSLWINCVEWEAHSWMGGDFWFWAQLEGQRSHLTPLVREL